MVRNNLWTESTSFDKDFFIFKTLDSDKTTQACNKEEIYKTIPF